MTLADVPVVLNGAVSSSSIAPQAIYRNPATIFVANFIGAPPMNLIRLGGEEILPAVRR